MVPLSFLTAQEARTLARKNLIIFNEIRSIENSILLAIDSEQLSTTVSNTVMTDTLVSFPLVTVSTVNITTDEITTTTSHLLSTGDVVTFQSTGNLPFPLAPNRGYYVNVQTSTIIKLCFTREDAIQGINFIDLQTTGSGTIQLRKQSESMIYYLVWKEFLVNRVYKDRMEQVIQYFKRLGYGITRKENPVTNNKTFFWEVTW